MRRFRWQLLCACALVAILALGAAAASTTNSRTLVSSADIAGIRSDLNSSPSFKIYLDATRQRIDSYFAIEPDVPIPVDPGGGYTHEQHKQNGIVVYEAGLLHAFTGERKYALYAKNLLLKYASLYPTLSEHPAKRSQVPGRMFWQVLNEAVWLVYAIQGYDAIRNSLTEPERELIETGLLRPLADFLSVDSSETFNRIHNHAAWAVAAVGTTGYVISDETYVQYAFRGTNLDGESGFYKLVDSLFSPDGYYTEGPYYQRYALMPFVIFARVIEENEPSRGIFEHRDRVLLRAIYMCMDLSYNGLFFALNDSIKDKGLNTVELRYGVSIAYYLTGDPRLLDIAKVQDGFVLTTDSFRFAQAIDAGKGQPYEYVSRLVRDGPLGDQGALGILRGGHGLTDQTAVLKATSHGFGHGHFDRLNWLYYDNGDEIVSDYGAARFLNIEQKQGGRYLPENTTWAKQTIAHNTLVVDERSHFQGNVKLADEYSPSIVQFQNDSSIKLVRATTDNPYKDVRFNRLLALVNHITQDGYLVVDIFVAESDSVHQYDLPLHFEGQFIAASSIPSQTAIENLKPVGSANGYQHLWLRARHELAEEQNFGFTWLTGNRFYSMASIVNVPSLVLFTQLGANDPNFNLRPQQAVIRRAQHGQDVTFVSVLESHGEYNGAAEFTINNHPTTTNIAYFEAADNQVIRLVTATNDTYYLVFSQNADRQASHAIVVGETSLEWQGYAAIFNASGEKI